LSAEAPGAVRATFCALFKGAVVKISDLLKAKGRSVHTIDAGRSVEDAIAAMAAAGYGALIVMQGGLPAGIFTERDVLRCHLQNPGRPFGEVDVARAMTAELIVTAPDEEIRAALATMIKADIRHLPVVEQGRIAAMLAICDLVEHQVDTLTAEIHYLQEYISDLHAAGKD
jgi:IMP dehydrogenase